MSPYALASLFSCAVIPLSLYLALWLQRRTIYRPIQSEEGQARDEAAERDKVKEIRISQIKKVVLWGFGLSACAFFLAWASGPVQKVQAALYPTTTTTPTNTRPPTATRTITNTPRPTNTPGAADFLTSLPATTPRTTGTVSGSAPGGQVVITRIVSIVQTRIIPVTVVVNRTVIVTRIVIVTPTNTAELSPTPTATASQTSTPTQTLTSTLTPDTWTLTPSHTPTPTETPTP